MSKTARVKELEASLRGWQMAAMALSRFVRRHTKDAPPQRYVVPCAYCDWQRETTGLSDGERLALVRHHVEHDCPSHPMRKLEAALSQTPAAPDLRDDEITHLRDKLTTLLNWAWGSTPDTPENKSLIDAKGRVFRLCMDALKHGQKEPELLPERIGGIELPPVSPDPRDAVVAAAERLAEKMGPKPQEIILLDDPDVGYHAPKGETLALLDAVATYLKAKEGEHE